MFNIPTVMLGETTNACIYLLETCSHFDGIRETRFARKLYQFSRQK
jgi:hypothetical protein